MEATEILMADHRIIEKVIDAMVAFVDEVRRGAEDKAELARFLTFIREFADGHHHGKEEGVLFAAMVEAGFPKDGGPIGMMLMEHDMGRAHVKALVALAAKAGPWTADDRQQIAREALGYGQLLREHIHKEDAILYPMAEQRLPEELMERVDRDCEALEARANAQGLQKKFQTLCEELAARHTPARPG